MTEREFQEQYGLSDEDLQKIKDICKAYEGKIISIIDINNT